MNCDHVAIGYTWNARSLRMSTILYVLAVFLSFMALAYFAFHSVEGVKALFLAAVGSVVGLMPGVLRRMEYQFSETGLMKRPFQSQRPREFEEVFSWDQLSHFIPTKSGFKFYKRIGVQNPLRRFLRLHLLDDHSGEFHLGAADRGRVQEIIDQHSIPTTKQGRLLRLGQPTEENSD